MGSKLSVRLVCYVLVTRIWLAAHCQLVMLTFRATAAASLLAVAQAVRSSEFHLEESVSNVSAQANAPWNTDMFKDMASPLCKLGDLYGWGHCPVKLPEHGTQSWFYMPIITLALKQIEVDASADLVWKEPPRARISLDQEKFWMEKRDFQVLINAQAQWWQAFYEDFGPEAAGGSVALAMARDMNQWDRDNHMVDNAQKEVMMPDALRQLLGVKSDEELLYELSMTEKD